MAVFFPTVFTNARSSSHMFETVSVGMMNTFTTMNGKTHDMECHVKDKFAKEVLLCGSFGDIVDFSSSKMLVFACLNHEKLDTRRCFMLLHPKQKANRKFSNYQTGWTTRVEIVFIFRWGLLPNTCVSGKAESYIYRL